MHQGLLVKPWLTTIVVLTPTCTPERAPTFAPFLDVLVLEVAWASSV